MLLSTNTVTWVIHEREDGSIAYTVFLSENEDILTQGVVTTRDDADRCVVTAIRDLVTAR